MKPLTEMKGNNDAWEEQEKTGEENKIDGQMIHLNPIQVQHPQLGLYSPTQVLCPSESPVGTLWSPMARQDVL